jgi:hypothetical protein
MSGYPEMTFSHSSTVILSQALPRLSMIKPILIAILPNVHDNRRLERAARKPSGWLMG